MATRSNVAVLNPDGSVTAIYVHFDGYLSHNGMILKDHYTDPAKIQDLIQLGALSCLEAEIGEQQDFDQPRNSNWCLAYGRDRGELDTHATTHPDISTWLDLGEEYNYLWDGKEWLVSCYRTQGTLRSMVQIMLEGDPDNQD